MMCADTCSFPNDAACDDGGPGAEHSACFVGNDCDDCGPRVRVVASLCNDDCYFANDGICDDGDDSALAYCEWGADCTDCGVRTPAAPPPHVDIQ